MAGPPPSHRELLGAIHANGRSAFRVWAPEARRVEVVFEDGGETLALSREDGGYFSGVASGSSRLYKYRVDGEGPWPDPCSRFQPHGVHGPSQIVVPDAFQ